MKNLLLILSFLFSSIHTFAQSNNQPLTTTKDQIIGEWTLDLRPTPGATPYFQTLVVSAQNGNQFTGTFYGSAIKSTLLNSSWEKLYFAFQSSDSSYTYFHSGYIIGNEIFGITYCPGRDFVMPWNGKKKGKK